ncbi:Xylt1 [Symbiodinium natans]|uniref:Xylt1 protein n=1 Tax=Symbiodinium natans TaxID=878477 RepID=A0A812MBF7_9DINO|nr:Xylt1 [Symbiodinium natans]
MTLLAVSYWETSAVQRRLRFRWQSPSGMASESAEDLLPWQSLAVAQLQLPLGGSQHSVEWRTAVTGWWSLDIEQHSATPLAEVPAASRDDRRHVLARHRFFLFDADAVNVEVIQELFSVDPV